jgi:hypothetical protein
MIWWKAVVAYFEMLCQIWPESTLRKGTTNLRQNSQCLCGDSKWALPEYKSEASLFLRKTLRELFSRSCKLQLFVVRYFMNNILTYFVSSTIGLQIRVSVWG